MKVEAIKHKDVRGKELTYIKFSVGTEEVIINVGNGTYNRVSELLQKDSLTIKPKEDAKTK